MKEVSSLVASRLVLAAFGLKFDWQLGKKEFLELEQELRDGTELAIANRS